MDRIEFAQDETYLPLILLSQKQYDLKKLQLIKAFQVYPTDSLSILNKR